VKLSFFFKQMFIFSNEARPAHSLKPKRVSAGEQLWLPLREVVVLSSVYVSVLMAWNKRCHQATSSALNALHHLGSRLVVVVSESFRRKILVVLVSAKLASFHGIAATLEIPNSANRPSGLTQ